MRFGASSLAARDHNLVWCRTDFGIACAILGEMDEARPTRSRRTPSLAAIAAAVFVLLAAIDAAAWLVAVSGR